MIDPATISAEPFPPRVNRDLRFLVAERKRLKSEREDKFEERDGLLAQIDELKGAGDGDTEEAKDLKAKHSDTVTAIEEFKARINWCNQEIGRLIENADNQDLYGGDLSSVPTPPKELFEHKRPKKDDPAEPSDDRPVGVPDDPNQTHFGDDDDVEGDDDEEKHKPGYKFSERMKAEEAAEAQGAALEFPGRMKITATEAWPGEPWSGIVVSCDTFDELGVWVVGAVHNHAPDLEIDRITLDGDVIAKVDGEPAVILRVTREGDVPEPVYRDDSTPAEAEKPGKKKPVKKHAKKHAAAKAAGKASAKK